MKNFFKRILFSDDQITILKECKISNLEEYKQWLTKNIIFPLVIVALPILVQLFYPQKHINIFNLIFNGSIPLLGINILFGMSTYLIKVTKRKKDQKESEDNYDEKLNQNVFHLRSKLDDYKNILVIIGTVFYFVQVFFGNPSLTVNFVFIGVTVLFLLAATIIGRYIFIIKDDFFEKTFFGDVNDNVAETKKRWATKFKQA